MARSVLTTKTSTKSPRRTACACTCAPVRGNEASLEADLRREGKVNRSGVSPERRMEENAAKARRGEGEVAEARMRRLWRKVHDEGKSGK